MNVRCMLMSLSAGLSNVRCESVEIQSQIRANVIYHCHYLRATLMSQAAE